MSLLGGLGGSGFFSGIGGGGLLGAGLGYAIGGPYGALMGYGLGSGIDGYNNNRYNMDMQNQYNLQYWNMQNEYNHPAAQMARFREAGLNPNLIYSQQNLAGSIGSVNSNLESPDLMGLLGQYHQIRNLGAQNENLLAQNDNLHSQNLLTREQTRSLRLQNNLMEKAGQFADSPAWLRAVVRTFTPQEMWRNNELSLNPGDVFRGLVGGYFRSVERMPDFLPPRNQILDTMFPVRSFLRKRSDRGR